MFPGDSKRYKLCLVIDVYSGRMMFVLVESATGRAHGLLFMKAITAWGLPEQIRTDNGKDYTSAYLTRFFADMGIEQVLCIPFAGEQKPFVERGLGRFLHDLVELDPNYIGHNVAQAQDIRARKTFAQRLKEGKEGDVVEAGMSKEAFVAFIEKWCLAEEHRVRKSGRLKGRTPAQMVDEWAAQHPVRRVENVENLHYLLAVPFEKTVLKKGIKHKHHEHFTAPELGPLIGRKVEIRVSPDTPGRVAVFYDDAFVCIATNPQLEDVDQAEVAARARERQKAADKVTREAHRSIRRLTKPAAVIESILDSRLEGISKVSSYQQPEHVGTVATEAAMMAKVAEDLAVRARELDEDPPAVQPLDMSDEQARAIVERIGYQRPEDPDDRFIRLIQLPIHTLKDREFIDGYKTTPAGAAILKAFESTRPLPQEAYNA